MTEIKEFKYFFLIQVHISLVNNMHVWSSYTRMICVFDWTGHRIVHHVVYVISYFNFSFSFFGLLRQDQA